jgi:FixJ family two-component response regulator
VTQPAPTVFVVDDDPSVLRALSRLLKSADYEVRGFPSAQAFLDEHDPEIPGCAILDIEMAGLSGLELQNALVESNCGRPVLFLTGHADVPRSVKAMKSGAIDFLTKPVEDKVLLEAVRDAIEKDRIARSARVELSAIKDRLAGLTPRELEVLRLIASGRLNKQIAAQLGTAEKTIKIHRGHVMDKLGVHTVAELVRLTLAAGLGAAGPG